MCQLITVFIDLNTIYNASITIYYSTFICFNKTINRMFLIPGLLIIIFSMNYTIANPIISNNRFFTTFFSLQLQFTKCCFRFIISRWIQSLLKHIVKAQNSCWPHLQWSQYLNFISLKCAKTISYSCFQNFCLCFKWIITHFYISIVFY